MIDSKVESQIVTGMIVSDRFLEQISVIYKNQLQVPFTKQVAKWCMEYYEQYKKAPNKHIQDIYEHNKKRLKEEESFLIQEFLSTISKKHSKTKTFNVNYILDSAEEYFRTLSLITLKDKIETAIDKGAVVRAENLVKTYERIARPESKGVDPFDKEEVKESFTEDTGEDLFSFPGDLGKAVGTFEREFLIAFLGIRGMGKTWWLLWTALLAAMRGYNVTFVSLEMSKRQLVKRVHQYLSGLSLSTGEIEIPHFSEEEKELTYFKKVKRKQLTGITALEKLTAVEESSLIKGNLKMLFFPSGTKTMDDLRIQLNNMESYEGYVPDVIVTDYADKFKSDQRTENRRHQLEDVWNQHKALAQERKCLVATASQANTARTGRDIGVGAATESMAKEDLADCLLALNQTNDEKAKGVMRVGITKHRHADYNLKREIYVTQCYKIGRPYLDSQIRDKK